MIFDAGINRPQILYCIKANGEFLITNYCSCCKKNTLQAITTEDPENPETNSIWICDECRTKTKFI